LGNVVHDALALVAATDEWPRSFAPDLLLEAASEHTEKEGVALPGYARALARCAAPYVEVARRLDAAESAVIEGVEEQGVARVRELHFRADRVDRLDGAVRRTDWKAGTPKGLGEHQKGLAQGERIQIHAYAQDGARARYVYLDPDCDDAKRVIDANAIDPGRDA